MSTPATVAHYVIERELGRGGMGVVLLARDTRLGRHVAIKALPHDFARDPDRRSRFDRESRVLAAINHPNVAAIYGIEESDGACYLVLELADGPTLAERLRPGADADPAPLPFVEALDVGRQIAAGLDAAHRHAIIHRDLKPANIKLRPDGVVKVLDFGIAAGGAAASPDDATLVAGPPGSFTRSGTILGTPGYMSPEQTRGWTVGPATDCWSFGCVLYECLTGRPAFDGDTDADRMAATLMGEPDWARLAAAAPPEVVDLVRRCLVRDPARRLAAMAQAAEHLAGLARAAEPVRVPPAGAATPDGPPIPPPPDPGPLIGREREAGALLPLLRDARMVTITGASGSGRTRLALHAARVDPSLAPCWAGLAPVDDAAYVRRAIARALGRPGSTPTAEGPVLLVVDGAEHAPSACADAVASFLGASPRGRVVATARDPLGLPGERTLEAGPLAAPGPGEAGARFEAAALFLARARRADPRFTPSPDDAARIAALCHRIGGLPLAIELAATACALLPPSRLAESIDQRFRVLGVAPSSPLERRLSVIIAWRIALLSGPEQTLIRRLALFPGGATGATLAAVCGAESSMARADDEAGGPPTPIESRCLEMLLALEQSGLVRADVRDTRAERTRWSLPAPVRRHAREGPPGDDDAAAAARFTAYFARLGRAILPRLSGAAGGGWHDRLDVESANFHAAARASGEAGLLAVLEVIRSGRSR